MHLGLGISTQAASDEVQIAVTRLNSSHANLWLISDTIRRSALLLYILHIKPSRYYAVYLNAISNYASLRSESSVKAKNFYISNSSLLVPRTLWPAIDQTDTMPFDAIQTITKALASTWCRWYFINAVSFLLQKFVSTANKNWKVNNAIWKSYSFGHCSWVQSLMFFSPLTWKF